MGLRVDFYLLGEGARVEAALPSLAAKVLASGEKLLVVHEAEAARKALSEGLWRHRPEAFLAHGQVGGPHDARQPILLAADLAPAANGARLAVLADGVWREPEAGQCARVLLMFGEAARANARDIWRMAKAREGWDCHFYRQEAGRWIAAG
jgi:DNA polymerase-3 subunit chi